MLKNDLSKHVSLSAAKIVDECIVGAVEEIYDYGDKKYAKCKVKEEVIYIEVPEGILKQYGYFCFAGRRSYCV